MNPIARTRIGKITLKSGGSVTALRHELPDTRITRTVREFVSRILTNPDDLPVAFGAVAFFENEPGVPRKNVAFATLSAEIPVALIGQMCGALITQGVLRAQVERDLGLSVHYNPDDDPAA